MTVTLSPAPPDPTDVALAAALARLLATSTCPGYVRTAAAAWLKKETP